MPLDVVRAIKAACGHDFPVIYRLDMTQALKQAYGEPIFKKRFKGLERTYDEGLEFCQELSAAGIDAIDVTKAVMIIDLTLIPGLFDDVPYVEEIAGGVKKFLCSKDIDTAVIAVGKKAAPRIYRAGDCFAAGRIWEAVTGANEIALHL